jgi:ABC-type transporter Mla subunit MlaD
MQSTQTARILGYSLVLGTLVLLGLLATFLIREAAHTGRTIRVRFPEIATLSQGDPVVERGVTVGKVRRIALTEGGEPVAELQIFDHRFLAADTRFTNVSHSLMGARKVWMQPGTSPLPLDEAVVQAGFFVPGLPETLHKVSALTDGVRQLQAETDRLFDDQGSLAGPLALQRQLDEALRALEEMSRTLEGAAAGLRSGMAALTAAGDRTAGGLRGAEPGLDRARLRIETLLASFEKTEASLVEALAQTERLAAAANDTTGAGRLLTDRAAYEGLVKSLETLVAATRLLKLEGLGDEMKIRPRLK